MSRAMDVARAAELLLAAYRTKEPIEPLTAGQTRFSLAEAYEIQMLQVRAWLAEGRAIRGHKVGLTSAAMRRQFGVSEPDCGQLTDAMFHHDSEPIDLGSYLQPRIEPEIAFVLGKDLAGPGVTAATAAAAVDFVLPALELIDSRIRDWKIALIDTVADNASSGGVILGNTVSRLSGLDLAHTGCLLLQDGRVIDTGAGGAVLGNPLNALVWLANNAGQRGIGLRAGDVILPGSITASFPVSPGQAFSASYAGLGSVTACFTQAAGARV